MGRRKGLNPSERLLRAEVSRALSASMGKQRGSLSAAAKELGITKQALSLYVRQKATPGSEALRKICNRWNLHLNVQGALVDAESLKHVSNVAPPEQMTLFSALSLVEDRRLKVSVLRKADTSIDLKVTINFDDQKPNVRTTGAG